MWRGSGVGYGDGVIATCGSLGDGMTVDVAVGMLVGVAIS